MDVVDDPVNLHAVRIQVSLVVPIRVTHADLGLVKDHGNADPVAACVEAGAKVSLQHA